MMRCDKGFFVGGNRIRLSSVGIASIVRVNCFGRSIVGDIERCVETISIEDDCNETAATAATAAVADDDDFDDDDDCGSDNIGFVDGVDNIYIGFVVLSKLVEPNDMLLANVDVSPTNTKRQEMMENWLLRIWTFFLQQEWKR